MAKTLPPTHPFPRTCPGHPLTQALCEAGDYRGVRLSLCSGSFPCSWRVRQASRRTPSAIGATVDAHAKDGAKWRPDQLWERGDHGGSLGVRLALLPGEMALCDY